MARMDVWSREFSQSLGDGIPLPGRDRWELRSRTGSLFWHALGRASPLMRRTKLAYLELQLRLAEAQDLRTRIIDLSLAEALARVARALPYAGRFCCRRLTHPEINECREHGLCWALSEALQLTA